MAYTQQKPPELLSFHLHNFKQVSRTLSITICVPTHNNCFSRHNNNDIDDQTNKPLKYRKNHFFVAKSIN